MAATRWLKDGLKPGRFSLGAARGVRTGKRRPEMRWEEAPAWRVPLGPLLVQRHPLHIGWSVFYPALTPGEGDVGDGP